MELQQNQKIIESIIPPPGLSRTEKARERELFQNHFDLIQENADLIINTPELFYCTLHAACINLAYLGGYLTPLGVLLQLWRKGLLVDVCDHCRGDLYIFCAGGSPLSGTNKCSGLCRNCRTISGKSLPSTRPIVQALQKVKKNLNKKTILRTKGRYFSFKHGLTGSPVPDRILQEGVKPVRLEELLRRLQLDLT